MSESRTPGRRSVIAWLAVATVGTAGALGGTAALAQAYPNKPVKFVVPFAPGSATDQLARAFGAKVSESIGQPVVVENKPGVNGMLGAAEVAKAAPTATPSSSAPTAPTRRSKA